MSTIQEPKREDTQSLNQVAEDEGGLFGIRALEKGFYGGVAQSRPGTPASIRALVPPPLVLRLDRQSPEGYGRHPYGIGTFCQLSQMPLCTPGC